MKRLILIFFLFAFAQLTFGQTTKLSGLTFSGNAAQYLDGTGAFSTPNVDGVWHNWLFDFSTTGMQSVTGSSGTVGYSASGAVYTASSTSGSYAVSRRDPAYLYDLAGKTMQFSAQIRIATEGTNYGAFVGIGRPNEGTNLFSSGTWIGIKITRSGGTTTVEGSTRDGSTETTSTLSGVTATTDFMLAIVIDATSAKFYVDGTLKATLTASFPTTGIYEPFFAGIGNRSTASSSVMYVGSASLSVLAAGTSGGSSGMTNPMTTTGDMIYSSSGSTASRLGIGTIGKYLQSTGSAPSWVGVNLTETTVAAPTGTSSTTGVMMGLAGSITTGAATSGIVQVIISGAVTNSTASNGFKYQIRYGTGSAPTNGAALTGTAVGRLTTGTLGTGTNKATMPFCIVAKISGLSASTTYWIDLSLGAVTGGTTTMTDVCINAEEK